MVGLFQYSNGLEFTNKIFLDKKTCIAYLVKKYGKNYNWRNCYKIKELQYITQEKI